MKQSKIYSVNASAVYRAAKKYVHKNWSLRVMLAPHDEDRVIAFPLEDCLRRFRHLSLDEAYSLFFFMDTSLFLACDVTCYGTVAAVAKGESLEITPFDESYPRLPPNAVDPMEVVYCDGTPAGYVEAIIFHRMITSLPSCFPPCDTDILFHKPADFDEDTLFLWTCLRDLPNWMPKCRVTAHGNKRSGEVLLFSQTTTRRIRSRTYYSRSLNLEHYKFSDYFDQEDRRDDLYPSRRPIDRSLYTNGKHSCLYCRTSMQLAKETAETPPPKTLKTRIVNLLGRFF